MRQPYRLIGLFLRVLLLCVLMWGVIVSIPSLSLPGGTPAQFEQALDQDRVTFVIYRSTPEQVTSVKWAEGAFSWHYAGVSYPVDAFIGRTWEVPTRSESDSNRWIPFWVYITPVKYGWVVAVAWALALAVMLGSVPRLANRWAWLWLFTVGQIGAILFLLLEPRSLWYGTQPQDPPRYRRTGGVGCLNAIGLAVVTVALGALAGALIEAVRSST